MSEAPPPTRLRDAWPLLLMVALCAAHPVPGGLLVALASWRLAARRAPGLSPLQGEWWDRVGLTVVGGALIVFVGGVMHAAWVRPAWEAWRAGSG